MRPDSKFFSFMSLVGDFILLNILFILTGIPILTIGPGLCAIWGTLKKRIKGEESYVIRDYFSLWKENMKNGMIIWCLQLPLYVGMYFFSTYMANHLSNIPALILYIVCLLLIMCILLYAFPLQATFINTPLLLIRNAVITAFGALPRTLLAIFLTSIPFSITLLNPGKIYFTFTYWVLFGFSVNALISNLVIGPVLDLYKS